MDGNNSGQEISSLLRQIPAVDELLNRPGLRALAERCGHRLLVEATRKVLQNLRERIASGNPAKRDYCNRTYRDGEFAKGRDRQTGDYNRFWAGRDLLPRVGGIKAAVLMAHAFNDWNVVPEHSVRIVNALKGKVPLVVYYHQGGHGGNPPM